MKQLKIFRKNKNPKLLNLKSEKISNPKIRELARDVEQGINKVKL